MASHGCAWAIWQTRLGSALRTALACSLVALATMFGPQLVKHELAFPAYSYVTTILIVSDGTLDDSLRGAWRALCATCHTVPLSIFVLWLVGPDKFSPPFAAMMVAIGAFLVALPECTHILSKRIAFGQIVIVGVGAVLNRERTDVVMHPVQVALSTSLGALAAIVAMLLPYPRLAHFEVTKLSRSYIGNASERIGLFIEAFSAQDKANALDVISQAKPFAERGAKLLQRIRIAEEGVIHIRPRKSGVKSGDRLQEMETVMKGMEMSLSSSPFFPTYIDNELKKNLQETKVTNRHTLNQNNSENALETKKTPLYKILASLKTVNTNYAKNLAPCFFLSCTEFLENTSAAMMIDTPNKSEPKHGSKRTCVCIKSERLTFAFKCSLSLFLAVLIGLYFNKENGFWSGLTIAISFSFERQATFTLANARAQGTAIGSVYGVLGCYFLSKSVELKILALLPWIIFTSFLRHSRMYGQAGGISAAIGALLILGRENYGPPAEFALARLTEAFIGLFCFILVEIFVQPTRAATLLKTRLSKALQLLKECVDEVALSPKHDDMSSVLSAMMKKQMKLKKCLNGLEEMAREAEVEPDFWFSPFKVESYNKLLEPLSKLGDLMYFMSYEIGSLVEATEKLGIDWNKVRGKLNGDIEVFKRNVGSSLDCLEKITMRTEREKIIKKKYRDIEKGILTSVNVCKIKFKHEKDLVRRLQEMTDEVWSLEGDETKKSELVMYLSAFGFCIKSSVRETKEVQRTVNDLVRWENPPNW